MIEQNTIMRVARPTDNLDEISKMYQLGLGLNVLGQFENHDGFDGLILGHSKYPYHLEFTHHRGTKVGGAPTSDNLMIFFIEDVNEWKKACGKMAYAGFIVVPSYNPYWDIVGKTFEDIDGYRIVLQNTAWEL
jgi:prolyl oligopeptidase